MIVELLYFDCCPGYDRLLPTVQRLAREAGAKVVLRRVETAQAAQHERFLGSPTVRVDGCDIEAGATDRTDYGLKCRLYHSRELGQSPVPPEDWIRAALHRERGRAQHPPAAA